MTTATKILTPEDPNLILDLSLFTHPARMGSCHLISITGVNASVSVNVSNRLDASDPVAAIGLDGNEISNLTQVGIVYFHLANAFLIITLNNGDSAEVAVGIS